MSPTRFAYDATYLPPAPVVQITLVNPVNPSYWVQLTGLVDTGADITVVPERIATQLRLIHQGDILVRGFDGTSVLRPTFILDIQVGQHRFDLVEAISAPINEFILGRNVLNLLDLRLNGPQLVLEILNA